MLFPGFYRCDRCGRDVARVDRYRGWRLCPRCVEAIVPSASALRGGDNTIRTEKERYENMMFAEWDERRRKHRPKRYSSNRRPKSAMARATDALYPFCDCGREREALSFGRAGEAGLFGGPFMKECPVCRARREVESMVKATSWLHPEWDDEEWLDLLYKTIPGAFDLGVLPDYWYALRRNETGDAQSRQIRAVDG